MKSLIERLEYGCGDTVRDTALMLEAAAEIRRLNDVVSSLEKGKKKKKQG